MQHFFVSPSQILDGRVYITGQDVCHISNVLRMKPGDAFMVSDGRGSEYYCVIERASADEVVAGIAYERPSKQELPCYVTLYQGLPKGDKMEMIIQKNVELGVSRVVPVCMRRCVVKLDEKKMRSKQMRWQLISESAAKQSGRGIVPEVAPVVSFEQAMREAAGADVKLFPYELAGESSTMDETRKRLSSILPGQSVSVFIGPEGGFDTSEVEMAVQTGYEPITLGKRILRTETAGLYVLSVLGYLLES